MRALPIVLPLLLAASPVAARDRDWPGPAPCDTTLQACIDAAAAGDRIRVGSEVPIDQHLSITRSLRLLPQPGYRPRLAAGRRITASAGGGADLDLRLRGFLLPSGSVTVIHGGGGSLNVSLQDLEIGVEPGREGLRIDAAGAGPAGVVVENVALSLDGGGGVDARAALRLAHNGAGLLDAVLAFVHVTANAPGAAAAVRVDTGAAGGAIDLLGLRIEGSGLAGGIGVEAGSGILSLNVISSVVVGDGGGADGPGLAAIRVAAATASTVNALNNTTTGTPRGLLLSGAALGGTAQNNLVAFHPLRGVELAAGIGNRNNLVFGNGSDAWVPGPGTLAVDPRLVDGRGARLRADSPAIDAGDRGWLDSVSVARLLPPLDADGLRRFKGANAAVDIGAHESGDGWLAHVARADNTAGSASAIADPRLDGQPQQAPLVGARRAAAAAAGPVVLRYAGASGSPPQRWSVVDAGGAPIPAGAAFDLFVPDRGAPGSATVAPIAVAGDAAILSLQGLDANPLAAVFVVQHRSGAGSTEVGNPHPTGAEFDPNTLRWRVVNLDGAPMPAGIAFNVYWQAESGNAFAHEAALPNLVGAATVLAHPLLDGNPCAMPIVQALRLDGLADPHPVGTTYDGATARWRIENRDGAPMPAGATFNVLVSPAQAGACAAALFADGFE